MDDESGNEAPSTGDDDSQSIYETLEADVLEETKKAAKKDSENEEVLLSDVAVTAEFDYIAIDDDSEASEGEVESDNSPEGEPSQPAAHEGASAGNSHDGPITRALSDFDSYLEGSDEDDDLAASAAGPELVSSDPNLSSPGAWGYDQPQVSGVFSRYEEETRDSDSDEFDLFEDEEGDEPRDRTLQDIVNAHEKQVRRLEKRLAYQKEVIQVVSELLVEARVISKRELKKRLRALRDKS